MLEGTYTITLMIFSNVEHATHYYQALPSTHMPRKTWIRRFMETLSKILKIRNNINDQ